TTAPAPDPALADVPLQITGLSKRYAGSAERYAPTARAFERCERQRPPQPPRSHQEGARGLRQ
ncbi:hypothetical protein, partial [Streptomyces sp. NPDC052535]|uniref:hypothetical protein n=1 Tax=Streptomyces sp. NPDC052535 TaxID=3155531 RepID=UPI003445E96C